MSAATYAIAKDGWQKYFRWCQLEELHGELLRDATAAFIARYPLELRQSLTTDELADVLRQLDRAAQERLSADELREYVNLTESLEEPGPDLAFALAHELLGCLDALPDWLYAELYEREGNPAEARTYHAAAVELLSDHFLEASPGTWPQTLYPVFVKDAAVKELPCTREGFEAWLSVWVDASDVKKAMRHWPPRQS
jgi:hypothetical protein